MRPVTKAAAIGATALMVATLAPPRPTGDHRHFEAFMPVLVGFPAPVLVQPPVRPETAVGYAAWVTGGLGGVVLRPQTEGDLRASLAGTGPRIVIPRPMLVSPRAPLMVAPNTTLEGAGLVITGHGLAVDRSTNVIVRGVKVTDCAGDAVSVSRSQGVWLDRLTLASCSDGLIDIVLGSSDVTVSRTHMSQHKKAMLVGGNDDGYGGRVDRVTLWRVAFLGTAYRHPKARFASVHVANCLIDGWGEDAIDIAAGARLFIEQSYIQGRLKGSGAAVRRLWPDRPPGFVTAAGLLLSPSDLVVQADGTVPPPPYSRAFVRPWSPSLDAELRQPQR